MNLEVDVMEGDEFTLWGSDVYQRRSSRCRLIRFRDVAGWCKDDLNDKETPLDLPTFTRFCEGCGLTVKMVKPEPKVETIKPPEWGVAYTDGSVIPFMSPEVAEKFVKGSPSGWGTRIVRIDWGAK